MFVRISKISLWGNFDGLRDSRGTLVNSVAAAHDHLCYSSTGPISLRWLGLIYDCIHNLS